MIYLLLIPLGKLLDSYQTVVDGATTPQHEVKITSKHCPKGSQTSALLTETLENL